MSEPLYIVQGVCGVQAHVYKNENGYSVVGYDQDADEFLPSIRIVPTLEWAKEVADKFKVKESS